MQTEHEKKGNAGKGRGGIAEHRVVLPSCLHSIAEAVNCKELKHIGHLRHPSFQKLPLYPSPWRSTQFIAMPADASCAVTLPVTLRGGPINNLSLEYVQGKDWLLASSGI